MGREEERLDLCRPTVTRPKDSIQSAVRAREHFSATDDWPYHHDLRIGRKRVKFPWGPLSQRQTIEGVEWRCTTTVPLTEDH